MKKLLFISSFLLLSLLIACSSGSNNTSTPAGNSEANLPMSGKKVYDTYCVACHGADGKMAFSGATDLSQSTLDLETRILQITNGKGVMNAFKGIISSDEIKSVAIYIEELRVK